MYGWTTSPYYPISRIVDVHPEAYKPLLEEGEEIPRAWVFPEPLPPDSQRSIQGPLTLQQLDAILDSGIRSCNMRYGAEVVSIRSHFRAQTVYMGSKRSWNISTGAH